MDRGRQSMRLDLEGRVALVTGASRGIGLAIAQALAAEGAQLGLAARGHEGLQQACAEIGGNASAHLADVTDPAAAMALAQEVEQQHGRIGILVCNVGSGASVPPGQETSAEWRRVLDLNLFATTNIIEDARPIMQRRADDRAIG